MERSIVADLLSTSSLDDEQRKQLLSDISQWLGLLGYEDEAVKVYDSYVTVQTSWKRQVDVTLYLIPLDRVTLNIIAIYYAEPIGDAEAVLTWIREVKSRPWGGASIEYSKDKKLLLVRAQIRISNSGHPNLGELFYRIHSVMRYFRCWKADGEQAASLGLKFGLIDPTSLFSA